MDNIRGAILMVIAMFGFAVEDSLIKLMADDVPSGQVLIMIGIGGAIVFAIAALVRGEQPFGFWMLSGYSGMRAFCEGFAALGFVTALALVPISLVTTIIQASPLLVTLGAALFFKETVGWRRWLAIAVGLLGVLIVLRPFGTGFQPAALFAVMGVIFMSARDLATRQITKNISTLQLSVIGFMATIPAGALSLVISGSAPTVPSGQTLLYLIGAISIGVPALYCIISAMRIGDISFVSPFRYSRIIFGLLAGLLVFGETLDFYTLLGAAIIVGSGSYTLLREARLRRSSQTAKPPV
ncbi:MAG: DMT family transporter [Yoonia sp.]|nr:DMT family transporter [Yoonia sp.]MDG1862147.1 DMT family transporter [Yoonia sp.]